MAIVSIVYCKPCGYEKRAAATAAALTRELGLTADLVPGTGGIFEVRVGDVVVAERSMGHFPDDSEVVKAVSAAQGKSGSVASKPETA
jgi:selenoprotein W-related protein